MFFAATKAFIQLFSPAFRSILFKSLGLTIGLLIVAIVALTTLFGMFAALPGWMEWTIQILGGLGLVVGSIFLIGPITGLIASLHLDDIAQEIERRDYPNDPEGRALSTVEGLKVAVKFGLLVIGVNILVLFLLLVPGVNIVAFFVANGYLLGREYFELAALRYMPLEEAQTLRQDNRLRVFLSGLIIAGMISVPLLNLLTPLFATAFMVHSVKSVRPYTGRSKVGT
ncbi:MAG: sulfate transporter family protein [Hyphomicrobiaceae bacterium]|nr:sulfate transporter family protein [Hyphomicrobiaceae bacterium]